MEFYMFFRLYFASFLCLTLSLLSCEKPPETAKTAPSAPPKQAQAQSQTPTQTLTAKAIQNSQLEIRTAGPRTLQQVKDFPGKIALDQHRVRSVSSKVAGVAAHCDKHIGERVQAGEILAVIESRELADLRLEYLQRSQERELAQKQLQREDSLSQRIQSLIRALRQGQSPEKVHQQVLSLQIGSSKSQLLSFYSRLKLAHQSYTREKDLIASQLATSQEFEAARQELESARAMYLGALEEITWQRENVLLEQRKNLSLADSALNSSKAKLLTFGPAGLQSLSPSQLTRFEIRSPISGVVVEKPINQGQGVMPESPLYTIADLSEIWAEVQIYESELDHVRLGQRVVVRAEGLKQSSSGQITHVKPLVNETSRSAEAHAHLANPGLIWRPGMYVTVAVTEGVFPVPVAVQRIAVQQFEGKPVIFVKQGNTFQMRPVQLGRQDREWVEIRTGLKPGENYVSKNSFVIKSVFLTAGEE